MTRGPIRTLEFQALGETAHHHAETAMGCYKHLIGPKLYARNRPAQDDPAQVGDFALAIQVFNRMIHTAKPVSVHR